MEPERRPPTLHLLVGLPCAGKTTRAKELERDLPALRLTPDEWIVGMLGNDLPLDQLRALRDPVEAMLWDIADRLLLLGVDVILDFGAWAHEEREGFRDRAARHGARSEIHFLDVTEEELVTRLKARNAALPFGTFYISEDDLRSWVPLFERPTAEELLPREP